MIEENKSESTNKKKVIITGCAGFIGAATSIKFIRNNFEVIGIDNMNNYYQVSLKKERLKLIERASNLKKSSWVFRCIDISNNKNLEDVFNEFRPCYVINLAAQAGVRYSLINPNSYIKSNLLGFANILENCKKYKIKHLVYASSSSVYGENKSLPFKESDNVDHPISLYAATKKSNELMAHSYSHIYGIPTTGLRFFTVYGPWGRPDMAPMIFANSIINNKEIKLFNFGRSLRDFTFIDDVVESIYKCALKIPSINNQINTENQSLLKSPKFKVFNVGNSSPVILNDFINLIEKKLNKQAKKVYLPLEPGDVQNTFSCGESLKNWIGFNPKTSLNDGLDKFVSWYLKYSEK